MAEIEYFLDIHELSTVIDTDDIHRIRIQIEGFIDADEPSTVLDVLDVEAIALEGYI